MDNYPRTRKQFRMRRTANPEESDFSKFERTINVLLSQISLIDDVQFALMTEKNMTDPISKSKKLGKICVKTRENGC